MLDLVHIGIPMNSYECPGIPRNSLEFLINLMNSLEFLRAPRISQEFTGTTRNFNEIIGFLRIPPAPRCGDSDQGIYVGEWMVPRCYRIDYSEKGVLFTKTTQKCLGVFDVLGKIGGVFKQAHS